MPTPRNAPYKKRIEQFKQRRNSCRVIDVKRMRVGERYWASNGQGYQKQGDGSVRRIMDPMPPNLWASLRQMFRA